MDIISRFHRWQPANDRPPGNEIEKALVGRVVIHSVWCIALAVLLYGILADVNGAFAMGMIGVIATPVLCAISIEQCNGYGKSHVGVFMLARLTLVTNLLAPTIVVVASQSFISEPMAWIFVTVIHFTCAIFMGLIPMIDSRTRKYIFAGIYHSPAGKNGINWREVYDGKR